MVAKKTTTKKDQNDQDNGQNGQNNQESKVVNINHGTNSVEECFFDRHEIEIGSTMLRRGKAPPKYFQVVGVYEDPNKSRRSRPKKQQSVNKTSDIIQLMDMETGQKSTLHVFYTQYSAIWFLVK